MLELNKLHTALEPELIREVTTYLPEREYQKVLDDPLQEFLLLEVDSFVVGAVWFAERKHAGGHAIPMPAAFIQEICVAESSQGRGYGRALMANVEQWAQQRGLQQIEFNVWSNNKSALSFYEYLGYRYTRHEMSKSVD